MPDCYYYKLARLPAEKSAFGRRNRRDVYGPRETSMEPLSIVCSLQVASITLQPTATGGLRLVIVTNIWCLKLISFLPFTFKGQCLGSSQSEIQKTDGCNRRVEYEVSIDSSWCYSVKRLDVDHHVNYQPVRQPLIKARHNRMIIYTSYVLIWKLTRSLVWLVYHQDFELSNIIILKD
ncbi:hypothetical protein OUZ56_019583 [Daphnia magna]|uniref:Uncharacterized protein n=1 Tax=Daphnia magna TaxID=35525 RepID=A0ABQ9ZC00_9CRUS|nr:hypothetical protein OUZ56_019583 [Daphnia magna]